MDLALNLATGHVLPQFHMMFDGKLTTVPFIREGTPYPNWKDVLKLGSQSSVQEIIHLKDTRFNRNHEEYPRQNTRHEVIVVTNSNNKR